MKAKSLGLFMACLFLSSCEEAGLILPTEIGGHIDEEPELQTSVAPKKSLDFGVELEPEIQKGKRAFNLSWDLHSAVGQGPDLSYFEIEARIQKPKELKDDFLRAEIFVEDDKGLWTGLLAPNFERTKISDLHLLKSANRLNLQSGSWVQDSTVPPLVQRLSKDLKEAKKMRLVFYSSDGKAIYFVDLQKWFQKTQGQGWSRSSKPALKEPRSRTKTK